MTVMVTVQASFVLPAWLVKLEEFTQEHRDHAEEIARAMLYAAAGPCSDVFVRWEQMDGGAWAVTAYGDRPKRLDRDWF